MLLAFFIAKGCENHRGKEEESILENIMRIFWFPHSKKSLLKGCFLRMVDGAMIVGILITSILIRFDFHMSEVDPIFWRSLFQYLPIGLISTLFIFDCFKLYSSLFRYASVQEGIRIIQASALATAVQMVTVFFMRIVFPRSYYLLFFVQLLLAMFGVRFGYRFLQNLKEDSVINKVPTMVIGAGSGGEMIVNEIQRSHKLRNELCCMIDDDEAKKGSFLHGVPVVGTRNEIIDMAKKYGIKEIILAIPSLEEKERKKIFAICKNTNCVIKTIPGTYQMINEEINLAELREVQVEDLLEREEISKNHVQIETYITGKTILVTGGGGSIGSELCRQIAAYNPKKLIVIDNYENNAYELQMELQKKHPELELKVLIVSVQNRKRMHLIFQTYRPDVVFHAAAHKHVPLMENSPCDAVKNNCFGTDNVAKEAGLCGAKRMVLISTDKAVRPTNIMGASKRICEQIMQYYNTKFKTQYVAVRFGNVLGSNGSVIPLFQKQIENGGPVTVTHPDIIRYFMTIPEAVNLVLEAGAFANGGEIYILDMGKPVKILDLAKNMIRLSGHIPNEDIKIVFTGLRPGEKLYEELLISEKNKIKTSNDRIFIGQPPVKDAKQFQQEFAQLEKIAFLEDAEHIREAVKKMVPEYTIKK